MWFRKRKTVVSELPTRVDLLKPKTIDEYLTLSASQRDGAILTSELFTEVCQSVVALSALQEKP
jgi:hypothetical protein